MNLVTFGHEIYQEIIKTNPIVFSNDSFGANLKTKLKNFIVNRQLYSDLRNQNFPFDVEIKKVNNFGYQVPVMVKDGVHIIVARTNSSNMLPSYAKYKADMAQNNQKTDKQLFWEFNNSEMSLGEIREFAILCYDFDYEGVLHAEIILPDSTFHIITDSLDIIEESRKITVINNVAEISKQSLKEIISIKETIKKEALKIKKNG